MEFPKASRKHKVNGAKVRGWAQQLRLQIPRAAGRFSAQEKLRILEEGYQNGILRVCNAYQINHKTYYYWKRVLGYSKQRSFTEGERRVIVNEAIRDGITKASDKHQLYRRTIHRWARRLGLEIPWQRFNTQEKRAILQEAIRNGTGMTCRAYKIAPGTYGIGAGNWDYKFYLRQADTSLHRSKHSEAFSPDFFFHQHFHTCE